MLRRIAVSLLAALLAALLLVGVCGCTPADNGNNDSSDAGSANNIDATSGTGDADDAGDAEQTTDDRELIVVESGWSASNRSSDGTFNILAAAVLHNPRNQPVYAVLVSAVAKNEYGSTIAESQFGMRYIDAGDTMATCTEYWFEKDDPIPTSVDISVTSFSTEDPYDYYGPVLNSKDIVFSNVSFVEDGDPCPMIVGTLSNNTPYDFNGVVIAVYKDSGGNVVGGTGTAATINNLAASESTDFELWSTGYGAPPEWSTYELYFGD
ncbi:MAG: hypothetical protein LBR39_00875 [Coriobacteriales bacterium]|jgi:hypothetical protein|nr:hypothetical protein [Coriobacteriales bacterium]